VLSARNLSLLLETQRTLAAPFLPGRMFEKTLLWLSLAEQKHGHCTDLWGKAMLSIL
jgi:hypothetical protein